MTAPREKFLQEILELDPYEVIEKTINDHMPVFVWDEGRLRDALCIPKTPPSPIIFTVDVPSPLSFLGGKYQDTRFCVTAEALARAAASEVERGIEMGIARQCQTLIDENQALRERIAALEGGFSVKTPAAYLIAEEVTRARTKYPTTNFHDRIDGFVQEAGEAMQALLKLKHLGISGCDGDDRLAHAREEVIQAAGQCVRLLEEAL